MEEESMKEEIKEGMVCGCVVFRRERGVQEKKEGK
jgi:hypothetical protein